ncbi:MAG: hypothetical protein ACRC0U_07375 [Vibrio sp.]
MERHEQEFITLYCYRLEKYLYTFWRRVNNLVVFLQIFLSTMVFSGVAGAQWYGALMTALTIGAFVYRPDKCQSYAKTQMSEYASLRLHIKSLSDQELSAELERIKQKDSDALGVFENPAYNRATIEYGQPSYARKLTRYEKVMAWLAGDLPEE